MAADKPVATCQFQGNLDDVLEFLKRTRNELTTLRKVRVWPHCVQIFDVNGEYFEVTGIGYPDKDVSPLLTAIGTSFKPESIHNPIPRPFKEFMTGRCFPWAEDRIL
jgi:hypothetical protein